MKCLIKIIILTSLFTDLLLGEDCNIIYSWIKENNIVAIEKYLNDGGNINIEVDGRTLLELAVSASSAEIVNILIKAGANVKAGNPLIYAANPEIIDALIKAGAETNITFPNGKTPIMYAILYDNKVLIDALLKVGVKLPEDKLFWAEVAIEKGDLSFLKKLIDDGLNIKQINGNEEDGNFLLRLAIEKNNAEIVKLLIDNGADPNNGVPLSYAIWKNCSENLIKELLKAKEINIEQTTYLDLDGGMTPLFLAVEKGRIDLVNILIEHGANIHIERGAGGILFHALNDEQMFSHLLTKGADIKKRTGKTILHVAVKPAIIKKIIEMDPSQLNAIDEIMNLTPLDWAIEFHLDDKAKILRAYGAKTATELKTLSGNNQIIDEKK